MNNVADNTLKFSEIVERGDKVIARIDHDVLNTEEVQKRVLRTILAKNAGTEYGTRYHFTGISSFDEYCERLPITDWADYKDYVGRMMTSGEKGLLFSEDIYWYAATAGTTGKNKYFPMNVTSIAHCGDAYLFRGLALAAKEFKKKTGKELTEGKVFAVVGGVEYLTGNLGQSFGSIITGNIKLLKKEFQRVCVPPEYILLQKPDDIGITLYIFLRYGLICKDIVYMVSVYDQYLSELFTYLKRHWQELCDDIEAGIIGEWTGISLEKREKYAGDFVPDPQRAEELRDIFESGFDQHTIRKIWPELLLISATEKVDLLDNEIRLTDYIGDIPYDNSPYGSSECLMAVRTDIDEEMVLIPDACVYEFVPEGIIPEGDVITKKLWELEVGCSYELIITTYSGLYRYRINDLLEVVGRKGSTPLVRFVSRRGVVMNLFNEKTTEKALRDAITVSAGLLRIPLSGYSVYGEIVHEAGKGYYVVQFETRRTLSIQDKERFAKVIDKQLSSTNEHYDRCRTNGRLIELKVEELESGTYQNYDESRKKDDGMAEQYKRPLKLRL